MEPEGRPRSLRWLYGLLAVLLAGLGVAIGNLYYGGPERRWLWLGIAQIQCGTRHREVAAIDACLADQARLRGVVILAGVALLFVGTLIVALAVPWLDRRRLKRRGRLDVPAATERFAELSRRHGLVGDGAPELWVAGPTLRYAFTTSLPGRRPTVVVPARLALGPGARFDAVVTHELAHVLARDVIWVSALRGPVWLLPPVFVLAIAPLFGRVGFSFEVVAAVAGVMLLAAVIALLAAALLRLREHEADRYAAVAGGEAALLALFSRATGSRPGRLARHPGPAERALALRTPARAYEGGFAQATAVGFVTVVAMGSFRILADIGGWGLLTYSGGIITAAIGAAVLSLLFPSLVRRARAGLPRPQWWRAVTGAAAGVVLGALVLPVVSAAVGEVIFPLVYPGSPVRAAFGVLLLAVTASGVVALTIGAAELLTPSDQPEAGGLTTAAAALAAVPAFWFTGVVNGVLDSPGNLRYFLAYSAARFWWPALFLALLVPYALLLLRERPRRRLPALVALAATLTAAVAAILVRPESGRMTDLLRAQQQRWWICVAAGLVVLVVVAVVVPWPYGWGWGVLASTATTVTAMGLQYLYPRQSTPDYFDADAAVAPVWLSFATVLAAAVVVPWTGRARRPGPRRKVLVPVVALVATAVTAAGIIGAGVPGGVAMNVAQREQAAIEARYAPARRALTEQEAERVARSSVLVLPLTWTATDPGNPGEGLVSPDSSLSDIACVPLVRELFLSPGETHLQATGRSRGTSDPTRGSLKYTTVTVTAYSYDAPVVERIIMAAQDARKDCPEFQVGGAIDVRVRPATPPSAGQLHWRYDSTLSATVAGRPVTGENAYVMLTVGYTVITIYVSAVGEPLDEEMVEQLATSAERTLLSLP